MAFPIYDWRKRWCCLYIFLYPLRDYTWTPMYGQRVYHRKTCAIQHCTRIPKDVGKQGVGCHRLSQCHHGFPHHELLCSGVGMVPAICICLGDGASSGRPWVLQAVFRRFLVKSRETDIMDGDNPRHHPSRDTEWCAQRY